MKQYIYPALALALSTIALTGCDDFLDTMPDNRTSLDSEENIKSLLVSAYPTAEFSIIAELSSDNCDDSGANNPYSERYYEDAFLWKDEIEDFTGSLSDYWEGAYLAIGAANEALQAIEKRGGPVTPNLQELYGEAMLCRAYNHFMLAQLFCMPWTQDAAKNLGLPYNTEPETTLHPHYERGNLADFYTNIEADLNEGLKYVGDSHLDVPKYHFNTKAAYAFASRFYLTIEEWQKAADMATRCLGSQPIAMLRDYTTQSLLQVDGNNGIYNEPQAVEYTKVTNACNLMLTAVTSRLGVVFNRSYTGARFNHNAYIANNETFLASQPYGNIRRIYGSYQGTNINKVLMRKVLATFEYSDIVAQIGYTHSVVPSFTADETLLGRAEAYIMLREFDKAAADLTLWAQNFTTDCPVLTPQNLTDFYNQATYCYSEESGEGLESGLKKHLNPAFAIDAEGSTQECMLQCVLAFHRIETLHFGNRWFDIKRYGIEIPRRVLNSAGKPVAKVGTVLTKDDLRRAFQIPLLVRDAGMQANPR